MQLNYFHQLNYMSVIRNLSGPDVRLSARPLFTDTVHYSLLSISSYIVVNLPENHSLPKVLKQIGVNYH